MFIVPLQHLTVFVLIIDHQYDDDDDRGLSKHDKEKSGPSTTEEID